MGIAIVCGAALFGLSFLQATIYVAEGTVLLNDPRSSGGIASDIGLVLDPSRYVRNQAQVMESPQVAARAAMLLDDGTTATEVQDSVSVEAASNLDAVTISASAPAPDQAVRLVIAVEAAYEETVSEQIAIAVNSSIAALESSKAETEAQIADLDTQLADNPDDVSLEAQRTAAISRLVALDNRTEQLATSASLYGSGVQLFVAPELPTSPTQPLPLRNAVAGFIVGLLGAAVWAWWHADRNQVADDRNAPAVALDAPLLATVPDFKSVGVKGPAPTLTDPFSRAAEAYRFAASSLRFALDAAGGSIVLITSTSPADGKSVTALNIAIAAMIDKHDVLLVDADNRAQGLSRLAGFDVENSPTEIEGSGVGEDRIITWALSSDLNVPLIPARSDVSGNGAAVNFRSPRLRASFHALLADRDLVIIDSPPVMAAAETADIATLADGIVMVVTEGTPLRHLTEARNRVSMSGTPIIGYIFNRATPRADMNAYGYGYGYGKPTEQ